MSVYLGTTEITKLRDLAPQTGLDITDLWFGSTNVYTVWETYEGTLPATFNANGDNLRQYQVWGNTGGVGDKTLNLFDKNATDTTKGYVNNAYLNVSGQVVNFGVYPISHWQISEYISVEPNESYYQKSANTHQSPCLCEYDSSFGFLRATSFGGNDYVKITTTAQTRFVRLSVWDDNTNNFAMFTKGTTPPETFVPFGHEVDMNVKSGNIYNTDETTWSANGAILDDNGNPTSAGSHYTTNFTAVKPETTYYLSGIFRSGVSNNRIYFYDGNKSWISRSAQINTASIRTFTTPADCRFIQIQASNDVHSTADWNIREGTTPPDEYQPYSNTVIPIYIGDEPLEKDEYIDYQAGKVFRCGNNIFDLGAKSGANGYINDRYLTSTGSLQTSSLWYVSEYMDVEFKKYKVVSGIQSAAAIAEYDENKNFLAAHTYTSGIGMTFEVLSNCKYLRMSIYKNAESNTSLNALQPTDPPVPLPALPTCEGTTVIDYAGESVAPEKVLLKYRKEGL